MWRIPGSSSWTSPAAARPASMISIIEPFSALGFETRVAPDRQAGTFVER